MKSTAKYMFDEDFATGEKPTMTVVEAERRRADAEAQAHRKGFAAGQAQAQSEAAQRAAAALARIADGLERLDRALTGIETRLETEAVEVAVAVAAKLAPQLIAREPFVEISALATECFHHLVATPHVVVHLAADIHDVAKDKLESLSSQQLKVLALVADGKTNKEIAVSMGLSDKTVKNYFSNILDKLDLTRRSQAAAFYAQRSGIKY